LYSAMAESVCVDAAGKLGWRNWQTRRTQNSVPQVLAKVSKGRISEIRRGKTPPMNADGGATLVGFFWVGLGFLCQGLTD
jgi:hypothetical protein